ncbi:MAG: lipopolysaccharide transport system ATP-binding protein [Patescibacteria group bacterium]|nr:lipopolysaccharide transport system ATP-binding protein [Patescibacteria group bacterium]
MKRISVKNLNKKFTLDRKGRQGALAKIVSIFSKSSDDKNLLTVADNVSIDIQQGEIIGIIGHNGSGKSTLLRLIAGIYQKDSGEIETNGRLIYLNGYGQGLQPRLTMRENISLMGALMGLSQNDIKKRFDEIVEFSGLSEFVDAKVYKFSSGMITRLNFSVTMHCVKHHNPEILLLDEIFSAGGDIEFFDKSTRLVENLVNGGATVILVSHELSLIEKYSDKVIWLEHGRIREEGPSEKVLASYKNQ